MGPVFPPYFFPVLLLVFLASLAIAPPLASTLVRYRANYAPKRIQLPLEDAAVEETPVAQRNAIGYFGMIKRVFKLEGWTGFYKGFMPTLLGAIFSSFFFVQVTGMSSTILPQAGFTNGIVSILVSLLVGIPLQIIINRAIVTPFRLPTFGLLTSLRTLLTPYERRRPWVLYLTPGLVVAVVLQMTLQLSLNEVSRLFIAPLLRDHRHPLYIVMIICQFASSLVVVTISVPLQVIAIKLSIQRNFGGEQEDPNSVDSGLQEDLNPVDSGLQEYSSEHVVEIRDSVEPYTGFIDCTSKIVHEEGWMTMFRAWWINVLPFSFLFFPGLVSAMGLPLN